MTGPGTTILQPELTKTAFGIGAAGGELDTVHGFMAAELNPEPMNEIGPLPPTPFVGETDNVGTTVKPIDTGSPPGLPVTVTVQVLSAVADGPTVKLPVPVPPLIEHDEPTIRRAPLRPEFDVMLHDVSVTSRPLATNEIDWPGEPYDGVSVRSVATVTLNVPTPVSPKFPVTTTV